MADVGDVHAHLPQSAAQAADGQRVVKVLGILGVDGEGGDAAEVLAPGYFLGGDFIGNLVRGGLHVFGVGVRQAELRQDGVHLGVVVARAAQDVDDLSDGVLGLVRPFDDFHHRLVAAPSAFQLVLGDEDVVGQRAVLGQQEGIALGHLQCAHETVVGALQHLQHLALGGFAAPAGVVSNAHAVVVHGMGGVSLGNEDGVAPVVGDEGVLAVALAHEASRHLHAALVQAVDVVLRLGDVVIFLQVGEDIHAQHLQRMRGQPQLLEYLLQRHAFVAFLVEIIHQQGGQLLLVHALARLLLSFVFLLAHSYVVLSVCKVNKFPLFFVHFPPKICIRRPGKACRCRKIRFPVPETPCSRLRERKVPGIGNQVFQGRGTTSLCLFMWLWSLESRFLFNFAAFF